MSLEAKFPPIPESVGDNPRNCDRGQIYYRQLRDLRSAARESERRQDAQDSADRQIRVAPQWVEIANLARNILADVGQDIEVAIWLIEAETRLDGFKGAIAAFSRMAGMIEQYGIALHPQPEDAHDHPFEMIGALNGIGREGTLIQPLRLLSLVPNGTYGEAALWSVQMGDEGAIANAIAAAGPDAARKHLDDISDARAAVAACDAALTTLLGADAPPFSTIDETLEEAEGVLRQLGGITDAPVEDEITSDDPEAAPGTTTAPNVVRNREEAFEQLLRVARYFRQAEPHSPIADSLETLVRRGRMDFLTLIEELIPDQNARQAVMTTAGIRQTKPTDGGSST